MACTKGARGNCKHSCAMRTLRGVTEIAEQQNDDLERTLIRRVLSTLEQRLAVYKAATEADLRNLSFLRRRFQEVVEDLEMAHDMITMRDKEIATLKSGLAPLEVVAAMAAKAGQHIPVRLEVGGITYAALVPAIGREDHLAAARWWHSFTARYAEGMEA